MLLGVIGAGLLNDALDVSAVVKPHVTPWTIGQGAADRRRDRRARRPVPRVARDARLAGRAARRHLMDAKLYVILGSHACRTGCCCWSTRASTYERVELPTGLHPFALRLRRFLRQPRRRCATSTASAPHMLADGGPRRHRSLAAHRRHAGQDEPRDRAPPRRDPARPAAVPADPARRAAVEEAERWGDGELQMVVRGASRSRASRDDADEGRLGPLLYRNAAVRRAGVLLIRRFVFTTGAAAAADLRAAPPGDVRPHRRVDRRRHAQRGAAVRRRLRHRAEPCAALVRPRSTARALLSPVDRAVRPPACPTRLSDPSAGSSASGPCP